MPSTSSPGSLQIVRVLGIPVFVHFSWFIVFGLIAWTLATGYFPQHYPNLPVTSYWAKGLLASLLFFVSILLHELGHSFVALKSGLAIRSITLFIFGGVARLERDPPDGRTELRMAAAGPAVSVALAGLFLGAGFVLWYSDAADGRETTRYEIYLDGSVSGLSNGSTVRYLGVVVGRVVGIGIDPRDDARVRVVADVEEDAPVTEETVARLSLQGVTGLLYVNLQPRRPGSLPRPPVASIEYPVIPSEQSQFDVLVSSLPDVMGKVGEALERVNALLSDRNIASVARALENAEKASEELPQAVVDARTMFRDLKDAANEMQTTMEALGSLGGEDVKQASMRLREVADTIAVTAARLDRLVAANQDNVDRFAGQGLADFEQLVRETRGAVRNFNELTESLERDPSRVIYRPAPGGVEIPP